MKEINIAKRIVSKRKEKGITQEELANYMGVSSASVSKWETEQSYPDILLLPQLATYFNITIDELMGYEPQMTKKDIGKLYSKLYEKLSKETVDDVLKTCREAIKKYFSCFPLLLQIGDLLLVVSGYVEGEEAVAALMDEAKALFIRVKKESDDAESIRTALYMESLCAMSQNPNEVIDLLGNAIVPSLPQEIMLASAYGMTGRLEEAETVLQIGIYQSIMSAQTMLSTYVSLGLSQGEKFDEIVKRTLQIAESFHMKELQPATLLNFYIAAATGYQLKQETEKALDLLEQCAELMAGDISWQFKGDGFFHLIDSWLDENGTVPQITPKEDAKQSMVEAIVEHPVLVGLQDNPRFGRIKKKMEQAS